jgi:hypothetical protein
VISMRSFIKPRRGASGFGARAPGLGDGFDADQVRLLDQTRSRAEADAVRHAEDMVGRNFPIVAEAEQIVGRRFAELKRLYTGARAELEAELKTREVDVVAVEEQLAITEHALLERGVHRPEVGLAPLERGALEHPRHWLWAAGLAATALALALGQPMYQIGELALVTVLLLGAFLLPVEQVEAERVTRLRRNRWREAEALREGHAALEEVKGKLERLCREVRAAAESEVALASELVAAYVSAAFSSLPAGVLAEGRELAQQREPNIDLPDWVPEGAEA